MSYPRGSKYAKIEVLLPKYSTCDTFVGFIPSYLGIRALRVWVSLLRSTATQLGILNIRDNGIRSLLRCLACLEKAAQTTLWAADFPLQIGNQQREAEHACSVCQVCKEVLLLSMMALGATVITIKIKDIRPYLAWAWDSIQGVAPTQSTKFHRIHGPCVDQKCLAWLQVGSSRLGSF